MQVKLIDGSFKPHEAEELLRKLIKVKTEFHLQKIDTAEHSEENIKHSEGRIKALETALRDAITAIRSRGEKEYVSLQAIIAVIS